jgi:hypothetical protein
MKIIPSERSRSRSLQLRQAQMPPLHRRHGQADPSMRIGDSTHANMPASADGCLDKGRRFGGVEIGHLPVLIPSEIAVRDLCRGEAKSWSPRPPPSPSRSAIHAGDHDHPGPSHLAKALAVVPVCALTQRVVCGDRPALHAIELRTPPFFPHTICTRHLHLEHALEHSCL